MNKTEKFLFAMTLLSGIVAAVQLSLWYAEAKERRREGP